MLGISFLTIRHLFGALLSMFKSYFNTALRFLYRNRTFSFINIFGLTLGTVCCLYILSYVSDQYGYDRHHADVSEQRSKEGSLG